MLSRKSSPAPDMEDGSYPAASEREEVERGAFAALRNRFFAKYLVTLLLSMSGMWVRVTAMGYLVYEITEDPFKLGVISFAQSAPQLLMAPIAGAYLDLFDRRKVLVTIQGIIVSMMLLLVVLLVTDTVTYGWLLVIAIVVGSTASFDWPARLSLVPSLVERRRLPSAIALNAAAFNGARVLGPTLAGWIIAAAGITASFLYTTVAPIPFVIILLGMAVIRPTSAALGEAPRKPFETLMDGYRYIWQHKRLRTMLSVDVIPIMLGMSYVAMAPAYASDVLGVGSEGLGFLLTANGIGSLAGTLVVAHLSGVRHRGRLVLIALIFFSSLLVAFGLSGVMWLALPLIALLGLFYSTASTLNDTLIQLYVDEAYRGRVMAVYSTFWGLTSAGGLLAGFLANYIGLQWSLAVNGFLVFTYIVFLWVATPMRSID